MQSDNKTALYYRAAQKNLDTLYLDNQMQQLLCYAKRQELEYFGHTVNFKTNTMLRSS